MMRIWPVFRRELVGYFATPLAYVFIVIFLFAMGASTFYLGNFYEGRTANLERFFLFHPWLYLFLMPALAMRLWAEEKKTGTIEILMTLPIPAWASVMGKFLAAWAFSGIALALTFPMWITVNILGEPDNGVILASYIGSFFMAGGYLAIGSCLSAATNNQVIAFVVSIVVCFLFTVSGLPLVLQVAQAVLPTPVVSAIASFSFLTRFEAIAEGVIDLRDVIYFASLILLWLGINVALLERARAG
ncbi:MAG: ABC transporter permease subunit [Alphaproteobacteria bacterium]|nr:ABC transporter permease subunit [Alphaproteobacteria bacterium]